MPPERIVVEDAEKLAEAAAAWIARALRDVASRKSAVTLALAGGRTPEAAYRRLALLLRVPWERVEIFFGDERAVPPDSPDSNYRMASESLLGIIPIPADRVHRMEAGHDDIHAAAREYAALLPEPLDILLLGIGEDGHTASLFPHAPALAERDRKVVAVTGGVPLVQRLTITPPVIAAADRILVMVDGAEKAEMVARALEGPEDVATLPAQLARREGATWILDRAAAARLG